MSILINCSVWKWHKRTTIKPPQDTRILWSRAAFKATEPLLAATQHKNLTGKAVMNAATSFILIKMQAERNYFLANAPEQLPKQATIQPYIFWIVFGSLNETRSGKDGETRINPFFIRFHQLLQRRDEKFSLSEIAVIFPSRTLCNQMSLKERTIRSAHKAIRKGIL